MISQQLGFAMECVIIFKMKRKVVCAMSYDKQLVKRAPMAVEGK